MKNFTVIFLLCLMGSFLVHGQDSKIKVTGQVMSRPGEQPLPGASVVVKGTASGSITDAEGRFVITCDPGDVLVFSYIGFESLEVPVEGRRELQVYLTEGLEMLSEVSVYSTGYQDIPEERATGSFEQLDNELLNRSTGTDIISRMEGVTTSLLFDKRDAGDTFGEDHRELRIRGASSIYSENSPLIIVDNFPYEGDINNINPNDVESVTILKDAAAASIWGARAANGVIVITTKKGGFEQPAQISFNSNVTFSDKPDLFYNPDFLSSSLFVDVELELFDRGYYSSDENSSRKPPLSPVVETLIRERDGLISPAEAQAQLNHFRSLDIRQEAEEHLFRGAVNQQYALNVNGGTRETKYYLSAGFDRNLSSLVQNENNRLTLNSYNTFRPAENLEISAGIAYSHSVRENNNMGWGGKVSRFPYNRLADDEGNPLPVVHTYALSYVEQAESNGLLDWHYRPLQEIELNDFTVKDTELRLNGSVKYSLLEDLDVEVRYQYQKMGSREVTLYDENSYYVRNMVNRFTQSDGTRVFPEGAILNEDNTDYTAHSGRVQLDYGRTFGKHRVTAMGGAEVRETKALRGGMELYGYDSEILTHVYQLDYTTRYSVRPRGRARISPPVPALADITDRYLSYFGNASYAFNDRYIATASMRWDGSNLFGVKTNQKGVPLWSVGASWEISDEDFYDFSLLPYLRLRTTYGYNGNINKSVTAFPTAAYRTDYLTGLTYADIRSPGNPQLRWEKIGIWNIGLDFATPANRISGSIEYYSKRGDDIIGVAPLDPTVGFLEANRVNYAGTLTRGLDLELKTVNIRKAVEWESVFLMSVAKGEITEYNDDAVHRNLILAAMSTNGILLPVKGNAVDGLYSLPWMGLDPATGDPQVMLDEQLGKEYSKYLLQMDPSQLIYHGSGLPTVFGAVRNSVAWKGFSVSANVTWKAGYYFRRSSIDYERLFEDWEGHRDFTSRWREPGDELVTQVPSMPEIADGNRDAVYNGSELLVEKGDHIRLQDINIGYSVDKGSKPWLPVQRMRIFLYARNLGLLWRANDHGLDPDFPSATYLPPKSLSLGLNIEF